MTSRIYSSFLLRCWLVNEANSNKEAKAIPDILIIQLQHLQSGSSWRLRGVEKLSEILYGTLNGAEVEALPENTELDGIIVQLSDLRNKDE